MLRFSPFVGLFGQDRADEPDDGVPVGEDADGVGATADLLVEPLSGVVGPDLGPHVLWEAGEGEQVVTGGLQVLEEEGLMDEARAMAEQRAQRLSKLKSLYGPAVDRVPGAELATIDS